MPLLFSMARGNTGSGKIAIFGASGECGAVDLFNRPSMTTGGQRNSGVFGELFPSSPDGRMPEEPDAVLLPEGYAGTQAGPNGQRRTKAPFSFYQTRRTCSVEKCPYCDGKCDRCAKKKEAVSNTMKEENRILEEALKKEYTTEMLEWELRDMRIR